MHVSFCTNNKVTRLGQWHKKHSFAYSIILGVTNASNHGINHVGRKHRLLISRWQSYWILLCNVIQFQYAALDYHNGGMGMPKACHLYT